MYIYDMWLTYKRLELVIFSKIPEFCRLHKIYKWLIFIYATMNAVCISCGKPDSFEKISLAQ